MKRRLVPILLLIAHLAYSQGSTEAKALLDEVYNKVMAYQNIAVDFKYMLQNTEADVRQETRGDVTIEGDKYLVNLMGSQQLFDGIMVYTIVPENEEVTIEERSDENNTITPSEMLTFYQQGHRYQWDIMQDVQGRKIQYVKLIPIDTDSEVEYILLGIDVETKHIYKLIEVGENQTQTTITVNSFKTNQPISKTLFNFDEAKYQEAGYYIIRN